MRSSTLLTMTPSKAPSKALSKSQKKAKALQPADYLIKILNARVYDVAQETALETAKLLSKRLHNTVLLKREDQQAVRSFKLRGAYNKMAHLRRWRGRRWGRRRWRRRRRYWRR